MATAFNFLFILLVTNIIATANKWPLAASAQTPLEERLSKVQPFHDKLHLPPDNTKQRRWNTLEPALGQVSPLDIEQRPKSSRLMQTVFNIYRRDKSVRDIKFRARSPLETLEGIRGKRPDAKLDFQYDLVALAESGFDATKKTIILTSGFLTSAEEKWSLKAKDLFLELHDDDDDLNVIIVGWPDSNGPLYELAVANTVFVARQITILLHYLAQLSGTNLKDQRFLDRVHLIGHSLGAHISAFVGVDLGGHVGRITALDPAGPVFNMLPESERLDRNDAQLVEVLHTNGGHMTYLNLLQNVLQNANKVLPLGSGTNNGPWFGYENPLGHVDYFANDGSNQEGCTGDPLKLNICNHGRAHQIFVDLLRFETFIRKKMRWANTKLQQQQQQLSLPRHRLWSFRADHFKAFESGAHLPEACPHLLALESHLDASEVLKSFGECAAPLPDLLAPDVHELIRELRDVYHINFDTKKHENKKFYFKTQQQQQQQQQIMKDDEFLSDQYLLKIYLDERESIHWDPLRCYLVAELTMDGNGNAQKSIKMEVNGLDAGNQTILAVPFAHPTGARAHASLLELVSLLMTPDDKLKHAKISELFLKLFPHTATLKFSTRDPWTLKQTSLVRVDYVPWCRLPIRAVEVHPILLQTSMNVGALYGAKSLQPGQEIEFVSVDKFMGRLSVPMSGKKLTPGYWYEAQLESALLPSDGPGKVRARVPMKAKIKRLARQQVDKQQIGVESQHTPNFLLNAFFHKLDDVKRTIDSTMKNGFFHK